GQAHTGKAGVRVQSHILAIWKVEHPRIGLSRRVVPSRVMDDADDLGVHKGRLAAHHGGSKMFSDRVLIAEVGTGHTFIYDGHVWRALVVKPVEVSSSKELHSSSLEETRSHQIK